MRGKKTAFLDRDGVLNRKRPEGDYVKCWVEFEFLPQAKTALRLLTQAGWRLIVVTNQRGIARGLMTEKDLHEIHECMQIELKAHGTVITAIYYCPHEEGHCDCRKPLPGMFLRAKKDFPDIEFENAVVIGDSLSDLKAGLHLGCKGYLISPKPQQACSLKIDITATAPSLYDIVTRYLI